MHSYIPSLYGQKSLWFLYQLAPDSAAYNVAYAVRIATEVNVAALKAAFQAVVDRHPCLRTIYAAIGGEPAQLVHEFGKLSFEVVQAPNWSLEEVRVQMDKKRTVHSIWSVVRCYGRIYLSAQHISTSC